MHVHTVPTEDAAEAKPKAVLMIIRRILCLLMPPQCEEL